VKTSCVGCGGSYKCEGSFAKYLEMTYPVRYGCGSRLCGFPKGLLDLIERFYVKNLQTDLGKRLVFDCVWVIRGR